MAGRKYKYHRRAVKNKEQGSVVVQFIVSKEGEVTEPKIIRSVSPLLDKEALSRGIVNAKMESRQGKQETYTCALHVACELQTKRKVSSILAKN